MAERSRILVVIGTRPEAIKLFPVIHALRADPAFCVTVCTTGQHRDLVGPVLALAGIAPDIALSVMRKGQSLDRLLAALLVSVGKAMDALRPDWVMVQGDTATALAAAQAAFHRRIRVAHVEAGLRSGDIWSPWPEELNRRTISAIAALHFAPTPTAADALFREGVDPARVHVTGNSGIDALLWVRDATAVQPRLAASLAPVLMAGEQRRIVAVTVHRRENVGAPLAGIAEALRQIAGRGDVALVVPLHPNPQIRQVLRPALQGLANVRLIEPLDYPHFVHLLMQSYCVLTDSGGVQEEAAALGRPTLVMRETTERPEGVAVGATALVGVEPQRIVAKTARLLDDARRYAAMAAAGNPFGDGMAASRIAGALREAVAI